MISTPGTAKDDYVLCGMNPDGEETGREESTTHRATRVSKVPPRLHFN